MSINLIKHHLSNRKHYVKIERVRSSDKVILLFIIYIYDLQNARHLFNHIIIIINADKTTLIDFYDKDNNKLNITLLNDELEKKSVRAYWLTSCPSQFMLFYQRQKQFQK